MLIDANVLIDLALNRQPHAARARALFDRIDQTRERAFIAWHTISNVYYVVARERSTRAAHEFIADLPSFLEVARTGTADMRYAIDLPMADFEDALQVAAASACGARSIVTRNARDFARSPIPAVTPAEALARLMH